MTKVEIKIPAMGESVNEATVAALLKENGAVVQMDEEIIELETDKVNQVLNAPKAGKLEWTVKVDDVVKIGQVIGTVDISVAPAEAPKEEAAPPPLEKPPSEGPSARMMEEEFVADLKAPAPEAPAPAAPKEVRGELETRTRMSKIRQVIARRLLEAQQTTAMLTTFNEIDMTAVMALRKEYQEAFVKKHGIKLGFMSWFVKGCVQALQDVPGVNSYIDGAEIVHRNYYDIGVAVSTERGLMVPVVRDCDQLSFAEIELAIKEFAEKSRSGKITVDDMQGGGFTITNGGIFGSLLSTPILNPPQSGILGMHKIQERPMVVKGEVRPRPMMYTALSYDHRIVDGREAVTFLVRLKEVLEDPSRLLIDL
jgi:2-oxoglutarate dehydrogenase E2 component (dihydrolipoamide succinyltransferase)